MLLFIIGHMVHFIPELNPRCRIKQIWVSTSRYGEDAEKYREYPYKYYCNNKRGDTVTDYSADLYGNVALTSLLHRAEDTERKRDAKC